MHRRQLLKTIAAGVLMPLATRVADASAAEIASPPYRLVRIEAGPVALRAEPSLAGPIVAMAPACACGVMALASSITADGFRWVRLTLDETGVTGWVPTWHLAAIDV